MNKREWSRVKILKEREKALASDRYLDAGAANVSTGGPGKVQWEEVED